MKIITTFNHSFRPNQYFDWSAITDDYQPGDPVGYGPNELHAIEDLVEQLKDLQERNND